MTLGLVGLVFVAIALTIVGFLCVKHRISSAGEQIAADVQREVARMRDECAASELRLVDALTADPDVNEDALIRRYQDEQVAVMRSSDRERPWNWNERDLEQWAEQDVRDRQATVVRNTVFGATLSVVALWCAVVLVVLFALRDQARMAPAWVSATALPSSSPDSHDAPENLGEPGEPTPTTASSTAGAIAAVGGTSPGTAEHVSPNRTADAASGAGNVNRVAPQELNHEEH
ncbi:MAG: hypothetical protein HY763_01985 [Planctomycetes bacterium]|nr:hypothetical protein [Planctomycetota bacterium]